MKSKFILLWASEDSQAEMTAVVEVPSEATKDQLDDFVRRTCGRDFQWKLITVEKLKIVNVPTLTYANEAANG